MGYGGSSKGGGGSGSAGGGKKKSGRGGKPTARNFKVKQKATAAASPPPPTAFTVREPNPENRARLLASRRREERAANAQKEARRTPVSGTGPRGRILGSGSEAVGDNATASAAAGSHHPQQQQPQQNTVPAEREARLAFLAAEEVNAEAARRERSQAERARREAAARRRCGPHAALARRRLDALSARLGGREESEEIRRLMAVVLRNAATRADARYRKLQAANDRLWTGLLRFSEAVALLEDVGFERRAGVERRRATAAAAEEEAAAARVRREREELHRRLSRALDAAPSTEPHAPGAIAALVAELEALDVAPTEERPGPVAVEESRDFELWHAGAGVDGLGLERMLAVLHTVQTW